MWPEALPLSKTIKILSTPFCSVWKHIRNKYINYADGIIFECDLFKDKMKSIIDNSIFSTIYLCKKSTSLISQYSDNSKLSLVYLGSINNIIDIELILKMVELLSQKVEVKFNIIGIGENKNNLIQGLNDMENVEINDFGVVYDEKEKNEILHEAHFGLNIMKQNVFVGATMKSLDYFCASLPIINNIQGDSYEIVQRHQCGINISLKEINCTVTKILDIFYDG